MENISHQTSAKPVCLQTNITEEWIIHVNIHQTLKWWFSSSCNEMWILSIFVLLWKMKSASEGKTERCPTSTDVCNFTYHTSHVLHSFWHREIIHWWNLNTISALTSYKLHQDMWIWRQVCKWRCDICFIGCDDLMYSMWGLCNRWDIQCSGISVTLWMWPHGSGSKCVKNQSSVWISLVLRLIFTHTVQNIAAFSQLLSASHSAQHFSNISLGFEERRAWRIKSNRHTDRQTLKEKAGHIRAECQTAQNVEIQRERAKPVSNNILLLNTFWTLIL